MKKFAVLVLLGMIASLLPVALAQSWVPVPANTPSVNSKISATPAPASQPLNIVVGLRLQNVSSLASFLQGLRGGGSKPLTHAAFVSDYSPNASQVQAVVNYLTSKGFTNVQVTEDNLLVSAQGTVGQAEQAFNTPIVSFTMSGKNAYAPSGPVMVPSALGNTVVQVLGLSNATGISNQLSMKQNINVMGRNSTFTLNSSGTPDLSIAGLTPGNLRTAYDAGNTSTAGNTVVAVVTEGDDLQQVISDLRQAEVENQLPLIPVVVRQVEPVPNPEDTSGDDEWDLDSQSITGLAYNVKELVFYNTASLNDADTILANDAFATDDIATVGNMSYGGCEDVENSSLADTLGSVGTGVFDEVFAEAVAQGQTWSASAGDAGAACGVAANLATPDSGVPSSVEYPASSPNVVAVGGTSLFVDSNYNYVTELSWDAGGGGTSNLEPAPSWQSSDLAVPTASTTGLRALPDIAMAAGPEGGAGAGVGTYATIVINGSDAGVLGTSWSSPLNVGVWARLQSARCNSLGFEAPIIYGLDTTQQPGSTAAGFHDVLAGSNGEYAGTPGWDYTTGYGTFDIAAVDAALNSAGYTAPSGCVPPSQVPTPTATLAAPSAVGLAPLTVTFNGSGSSDPAGREFTNYGLNYGDGSVAVQSTSNLPSHTYSAPGTYTASLQVTNSGGALSAPATQTVTVLGTPPGCAANGDQLIQATAGEFSGTEGEDIGNGTDVVQYGAISEPASMPGELVFTIQVNNLSTVVPGFRWAFMFNVAGRSAPNTGYYYVAMVSADGPSPVFTYGYRTTNAAGFGQYQVVGTLNAASNFTPGGTITLVLDESAFGLTAGSQLTHLDVETRTSAPDDLTGSTSAGVGLTQESAGAAVPYTLAGNSTCASNAAPVANLAAGVTKGIVPLAVTLDGSSSTAATGANIAYYQFNFGDGTSTPWQASPTVRHIYSPRGTYTASVQVADSRGLVSGPSSTQTITVEAAPPKPVRRP